MANPVCHEQFQAQNLETQSSKERFTLMGRSFEVIASFADDDDGIVRANAYMEQHPGVGVLAVSQGRVILADKKDHGIVAAFPPY